jgi:hypothetical protein
VFDKLPVKFIVAGADRVVDVKSASARLGVQLIDVTPEKGHLDVVKPTSPDDTAFVLLKNVLLGTRAGAVQAAIPG